MTATIGLIHATHVAVQPMADAFRQHAPEYRILHFLDEGLTALVSADGPGGAGIEALEHLTARAQASGADAVLLTCSAYSPVVPALQRAHPMPVVSADEAMLREALRRGPRIGIIATFAPAGPTTAQQLQTYAAQESCRVEVKVHVVPEAFAALNEGRGGRHDELVQQAIATLSPQCDVVVLAQISMARAIAGCQAGPVPILTSPETSIRAIQRRLNGGRS